VITFLTEIKKFANQGEKTGWTYIGIPAAIAEKIKPGNKRSFRVKGKLDAYPFKGLSLLPMGDGNFILALNADIRKKIKKQKGAILKVIMDIDTAPLKLNTDLMDCLRDEPDILSFFNSLTPGHRKYFSNWIESAKTEPTRTKRIAQALNAIGRHQGFGEMLRALKSEN
jgi:hypothetical protein